LSREKNSIALLVLFLYIFWLENFFRDFFAFGMQQIIVGRIIQKRTKKNEWSNGLEIFGCDWMDLVENKNNESGKRRRRGKGDGTVVCFYWG
jgi:hypothetical protein